MLVEMSDFRWHVFSGGYESVDCKSKKGKDLRIVVPRTLEEGSLLERHPLEIAPALYRDFAALELTEVAIISFADQWGPLKNAHEFDPQDDGDDETELTAWVSDPVEDWFGEIRKMKALVGLWDVLKEGKEKQLADVIELKQSGDESLWDVEIGFKQAPELKWDFEFSERNWPGFSELMGTGGKRTLARRCLIELVNESLWGSCSPWLGVGEKPQEVRLFFTPHNLNAALWLMFAQEILGERNLKQCEHCKGYFEVTREENERRQRSDKKYCSPKCRVAAFKSRQSGQA